MKITRFKFWVILAVRIFALAVFTSLSGCEMFVNHTNPVEGWQVDFKQIPSQAVEKDVQDYISKLPAEDRKYLGPQDWLTDGNGQHAIVIEEALNGTWWYHVLIYDKDDKRIKTVKYSPGHYRS